MTERPLTCVDAYGNKHSVQTSDLTWRPAAYAIVVHDGKILLSIQHGKYVLPGGGLEFGEMPEETSVRETKEETGIIVGNPRLISCKSNLFKMPGTNECVQSILIFYACDYIGGNLSIEGLDKYEREWSEMPAWVLLGQLDNVKLGSSFEWRDVVQAVTGSRNIS